MICKLEIPLISEYVICLSNELTILGEFNRKVLVL